MRIICPQCHFARELPEDKIPAKAQVATCPKCKHKFRFRELPPETFTSLADQTAPARPDATPSQDTPPRDVPPQDAAATPPPSPPSAQDETPGGDIWDRLGGLDPHQREAGPAAPGGEDPLAGDAGRPLVDVPFERMDQNGFFPALIQTIRRAMFSPQLFFGSMPLRGLGKPLIFAILISQFEVFFQVLWGGMGVMGEPPVDMGSGLGLSLTAAVVLAPILITVLLFLETALFHFCLILFKAANRGFEGTFRVMAYGCAPLFLAFVPVIGPVIGSLWGLALNVIGTKYMHGTSTGRVAGACVLFLAVVVGFVGLMAFAVQTIPPAAR